MRYVIRGSVRRGSDSVRVAARLLDAGTGAQLWAETYDRELSLSGLLEVQDDVADRVVATIADPTGVLSKLGREERGRRGPEHLEAYDCVLQGNAYLQTHTPEVHRRARDCLERAVELDPDYAEAWAHLSYVYREEFQHDYNYGPDPLERALSAGLRAVELDPASPMAHYALSMTYISLGDLDRGRTEAERAFELNPNDTTIVSALAMHLARTGDWERGIDLARKAVALNPEHVGWLHLTLSANEYRQGRYEEALAEVGRWNQPGDTQFHIYRAAALGQLGRRREARAEVDWLLEHDRKFASDPIGELRRYLLSEELTNAYLEGLRKAGLEVPAGG